MGKTAVFVLSVLHLLGKEDENHTSALILCHTRELAFQIQLEFNRFRKYLPWVRTKVLFGGTLVAEDRTALKTPPHIVIGTPGRVLQLAEEKSLKLDKLKHFILDECDEMLDSGNFFLIITSFGFSNSSRYALRCPKDLSSYST